MFGFELFWTSSSLTFEREEHLAGLIALLEQKRFLVELDVGKNPIGSTPTGCVVGCAARSSSVTSDGPGIHAKAGVM